jgi:hypothetical protein
MPRTRSETTIKKAEFAQGLVKKDPEISQTKLSEALIEKFGTGMDFGILSNIKAGREPFKMAKKKRKKKAGKKKRAGKKRATKATKKRTTKKKAAKKRGRPRKKAGRPRRVARRGRRPANPLAASPAYLVAVASDGTMVGCSGKAEVKAEVERLLAKGAGAEDVVVYSREDVKVEVRHVVRV